MKTAQIIGEKTSRTCEFEEYCNKTKKPTACGKPAYGKIGKNHFCEEHFYYGTKMMGIPKEYIR